MLLRRRHNGSVGVVIAGRLLIAVSLALVLAAPGCRKMMKEEGDLEQLGLVNASSEPPPGILRPVIPGDLVAVHDRGRLLHQLEKTLRLAYTEGMYSVGSPGEGAVVIPLVDVDPGGRSAQVMFLRWRPNEQGVMPPLDSRTAERWLLVSLLLSPDRVLDVELLQGGLPQGSHLITRVESLITAADHLRTTAPKSVFHLLDLYEEVPADPDKPAKGKSVLAHVYALSADGDDVDVEVLVTPPRKRRAAEVKHSWVVHEVGAVISNPIPIETDSPGPITVARAMMRGLEAGTIEVVSSEGRWTVVAGTGLVRRAEAGGAGEPEPAAQPGS